VYELLAPLYKRRQIFIGSACGHCKDGRGVHCTYLTLLEMDCLMWSHMVGVAVCGKALTYLFGHHALTSRASCMMMSGQSA
jgi:hypothetical protein